MITLKLTRKQVEEVFFATSQLYLEYIEDMPADYNEAIRRYNDSVDELRQTIKDQLKEQE